jgi:hypothetical protein
MIDESRTDELEISDVLSSIRLLHKVQVKKDNKAKAHKYGNSSHIV